MSDCLILNLKSDLALMPENLDFDQAAAIPLVGLTSYQMITDVLHIQQGQKVMIQAGSGGIGTLAIQLAKALGAYVATTTSTDNVEWVKGLGADVVIDYKTQDFTRELHGFDAVFDTLGGQNLVNSFKIVKKGGAIGSLVGLSGDNAEQRLDNLQKDMT